MSPRIVLKCSVKAMRNIIRKKGLVPTRLVFGVTPRLPIISNQRPGKERMEALAAAQSKMNGVTEERKIVPALNREIALVARRFYELGKEVLPHSDKNKSGMIHYSLLTLLD